MVVCVCRVGNASPPFCRAVKNAYKMAADSISQVYTACRSSEILTIIFKLSSAKIMNFFFNIDVVIWMRVVVFFFFSRKNHLAIPGKMLWLGLRTIHHLFFQQQTTWWKFEKRELG